MGAQRRAGQKRWRARTFLFIRRFEQACVHWRWLRGLSRSRYSGAEIVACEQAGVTVYLPKPMTSSLLAKGRFGKQDFVYVAADDVYLYPSGEQLTYHYTNEEDGKTLRRYWTNTCQGCALKSKCTTGKERPDISLGARSRP